MPTAILHKIQLASLHLLEPLSSERLYTTIIEEAINLIDAEHATIFLEKNEKLVRVSSTVPLELRLNPRPGGKTYKAFTTGEIRYVSSASMQRAHPEAQLHYPPNILLPLTYQKKRLGVLSIHLKREMRFNAKLKNTLKVFGSLATLALRNVELYENAQVALKNRELFMSTAAHELKTPLTTIHAYAQITKKKLEKNETIENHWVDAILQNSYRLQTLIKDLFSMSQMKMGIFTYSFEETDLRQSITHVVSDNAVSFKRTIHLNDDLTSEALIEADHDKLALAFNNVIGNAIKYSRPETEIQVKVTLQKNHYLVSVTDQGSGITEEDLPHVFEQRYQGTHAQAKGMGLGMYLCKQIIEAHHGDIQIHSTVGVGTTVDVYLPIANNYER